MTAPVPDSSSPMAAPPVRQDSIDAELVRSRLLASMFGRAAPLPRFGRFELQERVGQGGMGVVYRAWDPQLERAVAIKLIDTAGFDAGLRERALREARSLARLAHPNVITVFEAGISDERVWIAMEYVPGTTMRDELLRTPPPDPATLLRHWIAVGRGLAAVHAAGLIHRDVKPSNVLIGDDGRPRLIDFGLVRGPQAAADSPSRTDATLTAGGPETGHSVGFVGTRAYAAPEQLRGAEVDARSDQYSFCVSLRETLAQPAAKVPARIHRALARGLAGDPQARFPSLAALLAELEAASAGPSRRAGLIVGAATLGAVVAGVALEQLRERASPCVVDADALAGTWDPPRREALRGRFGEGALGFTAASLAAFEAAIDAWARDWLDARRTACEATRIAGTQSEATLDLRDACLERKRRALEITLDTLLSRRPDHAPPMAAQAPALLAGLPELDECADPERLAEVDPLPPAGPRRAAILQGFDVLSEARALAAAGALTGASARVAEFTAAFPDSADYPPLQLELAALPAQLELQREHVAQGVDPLVDLGRQAAARRLDELAASLLVEAAEAAVGRWSRPELERWLLADAEAALARIGRPRDPRRVSLRAAEAALLAESGRHAEALARYEEARALAQELGDEVRAERQNLNVAATLAELGRYDDARVALAAGRAAAQRRWGPAAPMVARHDFDLALLALDVGDAGAAHAHLDDAEAVFRAAFGGDSLYVARVQATRAKLRIDDGDFPGALGLLDGATAIYTRELGEGHELLAELHEGRGVLRFLVHDLPGSVAAYEAALRLRERMLGPQHPSVARLHANLGEAQAALGEHDRARASATRSLAIYAAALPADHPDLALPLKVRAQVELAADDPAAAVPDLERSLALRLASGSEPLELADIRFSLARALAAREGQRSPRATELARLARADFAARNMRPEVAAIDAWSATPAPRRPPRPPATSGSAGPASN